MGDWKLIPLGSLCQVFDGPHATPKKTMTGPIFLGISTLNRGRLMLDDAEHFAEADYARWIRRIKPMAGDTVFSYETRLGEAAYIPTGLRCALGRRMGLLRPDPKKIDPRFLTYAYLGPQFQDVLHQRAVQGSTVDRILISELAGYPIAIPPPEEQRAIAEVLGALDDKIESNRRLATLLEEEARLEFHARFNVENRELGTPLSELVEINPRRSLARGTEAPYVDMASLPTASALISSSRRRPYGSGQRFINGDVLMARITPCLENGKTAFVDILAPGETGWGSTEFLVFRSRPPLPCEWAYLMARSEAFVEYAVRNMSGTSGRQRCPASAFDRYRIDPPLPEDVSEFASRVSLSFVRMGVARDESRSLAELRDALLPELLSGRLRVKAAERVAERVT